MTLDEAIEQFKYDAECNRADLDLSYAEDNEQVAEWLEELKQYRAIGTPEECRAAVEKQTAKKMESPWCPCCGKFLTTEYMNKRYHCIYCGQLLEWGDEE